MRYWPTIGMKIVYGQVWDGYLHCGCLCVGSLELSPQGHLRDFYNVDSDRLFRWVTVS